MSTKTMADYDYFKPITERPQVKEEEKKKKWIRTKEGIERYSMGKTKFLSLAREAGAAVQIERTILIDSEQFELYLETFRIPGGVR